MKTTLCLVLLCAFLRKERKGSVGGTDLQVTGLNFSNHSINATLSERAPTATTPSTQPAGDNSFRSEVYRMHANSLMLLHAQRTRSGVGAKKSQLNIKSISSGINYHIRKKSNETVNAVTDNEKHLEAKLGDLPQVRQKRSTNELGERGLDLIKGDKSIHQNNPCSHSLYNMTVDCRQHGRHHHHHHHRDGVHRHRRRTHRWRSIVQGEDVYGEEVKKIKVYPEKFPDKRMLKSNRTTRKTLIERPPLLLTSDMTLKRSRLKRALLLMAPGFDENPLYDGEQQEALTAHQQMQWETPSETESLQNKQLYEPTSMASSIYKDRGFDFQEAKSEIFEPIPAIPPISQIQDEPITIGIPQISRIKPLINEERAEGRALNSIDKFVDEEVERGIEKISTVKQLTPPTVIPFITEIATVSSIPSITDIPTLRSIPAPVKDNSKEMVSNVHLADTSEEKKNI